MGTSGHGSHDLGHPFRLEVDRNDHIHQVKTGRKLLGDKDVSPLTETTLGQIPLDPTDVVTTEDLGELMTALSSGENDPQPITVG
jgi:hypothetical protein